MAYKNHHQIFTHDSDRGIMIGQVWRRKSNSTLPKYDYEVMCISEGQAPRVVLYSNKGMRKLTPSLWSFIRDYELVRPAIPRPYRRVDGSIGFQVFNFSENPYRVVGELRRNYVSTSYINSEGHDG